MSSKDSDFINHPHVVEGRRADGSTFPLELNVTAVETQLGRYFIANMRDITKRKLAENELREINTKFTDLAANVPGVVFQWERRKDGRSTFTYISPRSQEILGISFGALGTDPDSFFGWADEPNTMRTSLTEAADALSEWRHECKLKTCFGEEKWIQCIGKPTITYAGDVNYNGIFLDITQQKILENKLRRLATIDHLTGAINRGAFLNLLEVELQRARRHGRCLSVLMCDIDYFKRINDAYGHGVGDEALVAFSNAARSALRSSDAFGRLGGEEFAVMLTETDLDAAALLAERIRLVAATVSVPVDETTVSFTISIGVAAADIETGSVSDVMGTSKNAWSQIPF